MALKIEDALQFLEAVKKRFADVNPGVYFSFLELVKKFKLKQIGLAEVKEQVITLFRGHADLIHEFNIFLPGEARFSDEPDATAAGEPRPAGDDALAPAVRAPQHTPKVDIADAMRYVQKVKSRFGDKSEAYNTFMDLLIKYKDGLITINEVFNQAEELFCNEPDLVDGLAAFVPEATKDAIRSFRSYNSQRWGGGDRRTYDAVENAVAKLKKNLRKTPFWPDVLRLLTLYTEGVLLKEEVLNVLNDLIGSSFPKTLKAIRAIMPQIRHADVDDDEEDVVDDDGPPLKNPFTGRGPPPGSKASKYWGMSASEAAANCSIRCGPSYRQLPKEFPIELLRSSGRTEECKTVLNDTWMSVPSGSEDFKQRRKSQYEENLFRVEDDRYELDMLIETNKSVIRVLEMAEADIAQRAGNSQQGGHEAEGEGAIHIEERLLPFHVKAIKRVYGDHGSEVLEHLKREPVQTIPIVLARLRQKATEWDNVKTEMNVPWLFSIRKSTKK
eukprot:tig00021234_g19397.t1